MAVVAVVLGALPVAVLVSDRDVPGHAGPARRPAVLGPDDPLPPPPWILTQLAYHQCAVLGPEDLHRFGFQTPEPIDDSLGFCHWRSAPEAPKKIKMFFTPEYRYKYTDIVAEYRMEESRDLTIGQRPGFLTVERNRTGSRKYKIWVGVPSSGAIQFEYATEQPDDDPELCAAAIEVVTVISARIK
ncbi:hypothetical protein [Nocardia jiangsuensis]|uniref:DUF3558 domain-containing protein n=1 Tax=Nocardia jiangsuensis TaxID=1691563 RepID=A0ABV8DVU8_9NOCA